MYIHALLIKLQVDYCSEQKIWSDITYFKSMADTKAGDIPQAIAQAFMDVSKKTLHHNYKKRCNMTEASICACAV